MREVHVATNLGGLYLETPLEITRKDLEKLHCGTLCRPGTNQQQISLSPFNFLTCMDCARCGCARHMAKLCRQGNRFLHLTLDVTKNFSFGENAIFVTPRCLNRLILAQPSTRAPVLVSRETFAPPQRAIPWGWKLPRYDPRGDHCTPVTKHRVRRC